MEVKHGLNDTYTANIVQKLSTALSNSFILYVKLIHCHWNMQDARFFFLHEFLEKEYTHQFENIDALAERIRTLGHTPPASLQEFLNQSTTQEINQKLTGDEMLLELASHHEQAMRDLRTIIGFADENNDPGTSDLATDLLRDHEKSAWLIRSHFPARVAERV